MYENPDDAFEIQDFETCDSISKSSNQSLVIDLETCILVTANTKVNSLHDNSNGSRKSKKKIIKIINGNLKPTIQKI